MDPLIKEIAETFSSKEQKSEVPNFEENENDKPFKSNELSDFDDLSSNIPNFTENKQQQEKCTDVEHRQMTEDAPNGVNAFDVHENKEQTNKQTDNNDQHNIQEENETQNQNAKETNENTNEGLTEEQIAKIKEETDWPDEIINEISSWEEYEIYRDEGLKAYNIKGKWYLLNPNIDLDYVTADGSTNKERLADGDAPIDKRTGQKFELHHVGQNPNGVLAELPMDKHRLPPNNLILHTIRNDSDVDHGQDWDKTRKQHWENRQNIQA